MAVNLLLCPLRVIEITRLRVLESLKEGYHLKSHPLGNFGVGARYAELLPQTERLRGALGVGKIADVVTRRVRVVVAAYRGVVEVCKPGDYVGGAYPFVVVFDRLDDFRCVIGADFFYFFLEGNPFFGAFKLVNCRLVIYGGGLLRANSALSGGEGAAAEKVFSYVSNSGILCRLKVEFILVVGYGERGARGVNNVADVKVVVKLYSGEPAIGCQRALSA